MSDTTLRFSNRVEDYIKYRPHYPKELFGLLKRETGLDQNSIIADIGSGTGISSLQFLDNENRVYAIEPNKEMRQAAKKLLSGYSNFISINATAEDTTLAENSVDLIFCGQAFHWFDKQKTKKEFLRILQEDGRIVLVWNKRDNSSPLLKKYEQILIDNISEYSGMNDRKTSAPEIQEFFYPKTMCSFSLRNHQDLDLTGLKGRLLSDSYCPKTGKDYEVLMREMEKLYYKYVKDGKIRFDYETVVYLR